MKKLNKTQCRILELIINRPHWQIKEKISFLTSMDGNPLMKIEGSRNIEAAFKLVDYAPKLFKGSQVGFDTYNLELLDDNKARKLMDYNCWYYGK